MKILWIRERQFHDKLGLIDTGRIIDTEKDGISDETAKNWVKSGWAEEIKEEVKTEATEELPTEQVKPRKRKSIISEEVI